jgi:hypothetical protein
MIFFCFSKKSGFGVYFAHHTVLLFTSVDTRCFDELKYHTYLINIVKCFAAGKKVCSVTTDTVVKKNKKKNPAYGRQTISRPMRIVAPMPSEGGPRQNQQQKKSLNIVDNRLREVGAKRPLKKTENRRRPKKVKKKLFFARQFETIFKHKCSYLRPLLSITFPQGFCISKNIGHPTSGSGGIKTVKKDQKPKKTEKNKEK